MAQQLGQVAVESIVKIKENGSPVNFYVAKHDYESEWNGSGRTLLVRTADCSDALEFNASGRDGNDFRTSAILSWLNNTYKSRLDPKIQSFIKSTKYHQLVLYDDDAGTFDTVQFQSAIFLVSSEEVNKRNDNKLPIANKLLSRSGISWTRSPTTNSTYASAMSDGTTIRKTVSDDCAASPCFTLPATLFVDNDGNVVDIPDPPTLTVPQMVMQGQSATISWSAIEGADSYTLQRKSSADTDWTQVYSGANLSYTETVGTWTSLQYRVQAVFDGTPGGWATSDPIQIVSASALVISGTDGDLGTVVNDIPYSISTDTGNQITATITVNSAVIFSGNVGNSTSDTIPVLDLVNGTGTIVIEASVTASSGPVNAVRTWTYTKTPITFPNAGSVAQLTKEGENIFPKTLAECVRLPGGKTLDEVTAFPCQVYTGSYVGTGTSGADNPNELTFPFEPKIVIVTAAYDFIMIRPNQKHFLEVADNNYNNQITWNGNSVSWYCDRTTSGSIGQSNQNNLNYYYIAIG